MRPARFLRHTPWTAALLAGIVPLIPVLLGRRFMGRDHTLVLLGAQCALRDRDGVSVDPALGGGSPWLEDPVGQVFYPWTWLLRPFDAELAASLYVVVHVALAAAGASALGRAMRLGHGAALTFGVAHALSGTVMDLILHGPFLCAAAWVPLAWAGARKVLRDDGPRAGVLMLGGGVALLLTGGEPQSAMIVGGITALECLGLLWKGRALPVRARVRRVATAGLAFVAGALLAGAQVGATLGLSSAMARTTGTKGTPLVLPFHPIEALGAVWSDVMTRRTGYGATLQTALLQDTHAPLPWNLTPYLGLLAVGVLLAGAWAGVRRTALAVASIALLFSLGASAQVLPVAMRLLPPLALFRYPAKYYAPFSLAALLVVFATLQLAARSAAVRARTVRWLAVAAAAGALGLAAVLRWRAALDALERRAATTAMDPSLPSLAALLTSEGTRALLITAAGVALLASRRRHLAGALVALDLAAAFASSMPTGFALTSAPNPRAQQLPGPDRATVCQGRGLGSVRLVVRGGDLGVAGDTLTDWVDLVANAQQCGGPAVPQHYLPSAQGPTVRAWYDLLDERTPRGLQVARALGCTHLVSRAESLPAGVRALPAFPFRFGGRSYAIDSPVPEASVARTPQRYARGDAALDAAAAGSGPEAVTGAIDDPSDVARGPLPDGAGVRAVTVRWSSARDATLEAEGHGGAVLVLRRPWWPGYRATQRGRALPVVRAGGVLLAVVTDDVAGGAITLDYRARGLPAGLAVSALGAVTLVVLSRRRAR
jgi:hypothetical protein